MIASGTAATPIFRVGPFIQISSGNRSSGRDWKPVAKSGVTIKWMELFLRCPTIDLASIVLAQHQKSKNIICVKNISFRLNMFLAESDSSSLWGFLVFLPPVNKSASIDNDGKRSSTDGHWQPVQLLLPLHWNLLSESRVAVWRLRRHFSERWTWRDRASLEPTEYTIYFLDAKLQWLIGQNVQKVFPSD